MKRVVVIIVFFMTGCSVLKKLSGKSTAILVFSKTTSYRHTSITAGKSALLKMGTENNWLVDTTEDAAVFTKENLKKYKAIIFLNTSGNLFDTVQQMAFQHYINSGGGFVGIHAATDTEKSWPWYNNLVGAYFKGHPKPQAARYKILDNSFPAVSFLPDTLTRFEEIYNFYNFKNDLVKIVMTVDESTYTGGNMGTNHPVAWYHLYDGGKAFYTAWGHHPESFKENEVLELLSRAIQWVITK